MKKLYLISIYILLVSCNKMEKPQIGTEISVNEYKLFETETGSYILKEKVTEKRTKEYFIIYNGLRFGPYLKLDGSGKVIEKRLFWKDILYASKKYYWSEKGIDSISFFTYKKLKNGSYEEIFQFNLTKKERHFTLKFPIFSCEQQFTKLSVSGFDKVFIFPNLEEPATELSYTKDKFYVVDKDVHEVNITNREMNSVSFAVDFAESTEKSGTMNVCSVLLLQPTLIIDCSMLKDETKSGYLNCMYLF